MIVYKDRWWCGTSRTCAKAKTCDRVMTKEEATKAEDSMLFIDWQLTPACHEKIKDEEEKG